MSQPSILRFFVASKRGVRSWDLHRRYFKKASAIPLPLSPHTIFHFVITLLCFLLSLSILVFMHMDGVCVFLCFPWGIYTCLLRLIPGVYLFDGSWSFGSGMRECLCVMNEAVMVRVRWIELMEGCVDNLLIVRTCVRSGYGYAFVVWKSHR